MKAKFKIGDRVRLLTNYGIGGEWGHKGDEGSVISIARDGPLYDVLFDVSRLHTDYIRQWYVPERLLKAVVSKPATLADDLSLKPATRRILAHLRRRGSITVMEALSAYGMPRIAPQIHDLREVGYDIETVKRKDGGGHQYVRYKMKKAA